MKKRGWLSRLWRRVFNKPTGNIDGCKTWHMNDNPDMPLHRKRGPAVVRANGSKEWWLNGTLQRTQRPDGTLVVFEGGKPVVAVRPGKAATP